ncbi:porin [Taklimakanibacter lacteus]|uniref:porin n=1 Tax=Taklimakanibacter lacteus TaxID=2268456 RepID=UPI0013C4AD36
MTKWILLAGAAMAVTATAARADDLSALKAQIEALQSRVSQLEAQPQASMPSGYSLLSIRDGQGTYEGVLAERNADKVRETSGFTLSVVPTADAAPAAEVSVSGEIRTALIYSDFDATERGDNVDVAVRGRIFIKGKVDTAVGEVGGYFRLQASGGGNFSDYSESASMNKAYGWWRFAPSWELMAGYNDNTGALQVGWDWLAATGPVASFGPSNINNEQFRLTYGSGPLSFAISVEDTDSFGGSAGIDVDKDGDIADGADILPVAASADTSDIPNLQAYLMYSSDSFTAQLVGLVQDDDFGDTDWAVGGGGTIGISDGFQITAGAVVGEGTSSYANNVGPLTVDDEFWAASVGIIANLSEDTRLELGAGYEDYDLGGEALGFGGGVYWDPVSQVTVGVGATYVERDDVGSFTATDTNADDVADTIVFSEEDNDSLQVFFGTWLRFP